MNRTFWLTWLWMTRGMMLACMAVFAYSMASGRAFDSAVSIFCLFVNAFTAEFSRRRLG